MSTILRKYERLSGQMISFNKSSVIFGPNTGEIDRVCEQLQVRETKSHGKYLGMPMCVGKSKSEVFGFLNDRINHKLQGWCNKDLSKGGKLVLLKTAAQSIPNFWMSLFKIPDNLYESMERKMNSFWWVQGMNKKSIKWMAGRG